MSVNLVNLYTQQFTTNIQLLLQQKGSKLENLVSRGNYVGEQAAVVDQVAKIEANKGTVRFGPMPRVDATVDRRWVLPVDYDLPQLIDYFDKLRMLADPEGVYVQNALYALGRAKDDEIISAFFGTAKTGKSGGTNTAFGTGNQVIGVATGGAASGLNVAKLIALRKNALNNQIDLDAEPLQMVITSAQDANLLNEIQVISTDFNAKPVLTDGRVTQFLGINFTVCERLTTGTDDGGGTSTACPAFVKSGMHLGVWNDVNTSISQRNDLQGEPWQAYVKATFGATRVDEKKVFKVWCR